MVSQQKYIIDRCYVKADETKKFIVNKNGYVSFCLNFLYLGSWISYDLNHEYDTKARIKKAKKANKAMEALKFFWNTPEVDTHAKYLIYMAIPFNLLLWGSESWATNLDVLKKLEVFYLRCIRKILGISWNNVRDEKISNVQVRKRFNNIKNVELQIAKRRCDFLRKDHTNA